MDYDTMEAGSALDRLVAEKVMGWKSYDIWEDSEYPQFVGKFPLHWLGSAGSTIEQGNFTPSVDMGAAWACVLEIIRKFGAANVNVDLNYCDSLWHCGIDAIDGKGVETITEEYAPTLPLAICRAALKAVEARTDVDGKE